MTTQLDNTPNNADDAIGSASTYTYVVRGQIKNVVVAEDIPHILPKEKPSTLRDVNCPKPNKAIIKNKPRNNGWLEDDELPKNCNWSSLAKTNWFRPKPEEHNQNKPDNAKKKTKTKFNLTRRFLIDHWLYKIRCDHAAKYIIFRDEDRFRKIFYSFKVKDVAFNHNIPDVFPNICFLAENTNYESMRVALNHTLTLYEAPKQVEIIYDNNTSTDSYLEQYPRLSHEWKKHMVH